MATPWEKWQCHGKNGNAMGKMATAVRLNVYVIKQKKIEE